MNGFFKEALRTVVPLVILAAGVAGFAALAGRRQPPQREESKREAPLVETVAVQPHSGGMDIEVDGLVAPYREITVGAEVAGRVTFKNEVCRAGRFVEKGTPLVRIDPRSYELEVERLQKELAQAEADLREIEVEIENTESSIALAEEDLALQNRQLERARAAHEKSAITDSALDDARKKELTARDNLQTLRNQLKTLKTRRGRRESAKELAAAKLEQAKLDLERTEITAPVDGVVLSDPVEEDSYVQPGTTLVAIEDTSAVEIRCSLRMEKLNWLWRQQRRGSLSEEPASPQAAYRIPETPVTVAYELAGRRYTWQGTLTHYDGLGLDEKTRTVPCRVTVPEPRQVAVDRGTPSLTREGPPALVRGMYVTVQVHVDPRAPLLRIPDRAVRPGNKLWLVRDGRLAIQEIRPAQILGNAVLVPAEEAGLRADDRLIVSPLTVATEGMPVRVESGEPKAESGER